jgi:transcriptional regulator with XRE-family HTH domain
VNETRIETGNDVGRFIQNEMNRRGWSLRDAVAVAAKKSKNPFSYEHLRKIIQGNTTPSVGMLEKIAKTFGMEPSVLLDMHRKSAITRKYGAEYLEVMEITPEMYEIDSLMKGLLPDQREMVLIQIKALVEGNIASGKMIAHPRSGTSSKRKTDQRREIG